MFPVTSKPTPPTVFNLQVSDWVHCEEETGVYTQLSRNTYKFIFKKKKKFKFILPTKNTCFSKNYIKFIIHYNLKKI